MKTVIHIGRSLIFASLSFPLVAGPMESCKFSEKNDVIEQQAELQRKRIATCMDWDDLLQEQRQEEEGLFPQEESPILSSPVYQDDSLFDKSDDLIYQLGQAFAQAYRNGSENNDHWRNVAESIDNLRPKDGEKHRERRFSSNADEERLAGDEEISYHFFRETLPAIKKTAAVAAIRNRAYVKRENLYEKIKEEAKAWKHAKHDFETICKDQMLGLPLEGDKSFYETPSQELSVYEKYIEILDFQIERIKIEQATDQFRDFMEKSIIEGDIFSVDFAQKIPAKEEILGGYQKIFEELKQCSENAQGRMHARYERLQQAVGEECLEDLIQVEKITLWKNKNHVNTASQLVDRAKESQKDDQHQRARNFYLIDRAREAEAAWKGRAIQIQHLNDKLKGYKQELGILHQLKIEHYLKDQSREAALEIEKLGRHLQPSSDALQEYIHRNVRRISREFNKRVAQANALYQRAEERVTYPHEGPKIALKNALSGAKNVENFSPSEKVFLEWVKPFLQKRESKITSTLEMMKEEVAAWQKKAEQVAIEHNIIESYVKLSSNAMKLEKLRKAIEQIKEQANQSTLENKNLLLIKAKILQESILDTLNSRVILLREIREKIPQEAQLGILKGLQDDLDTEGQKLESSIGEEKKSFEECCRASFSAQFALAKHFYTIAQEQKEVEQQLKKAGGSTSLAKYNSRKYIELAKSTLNTLEEEIKESSDPSFLKQEIEDLLLLVR